MLTMIRNRKINLLLAIMFLLISSLIAGCDAERNELIMGLFQTDTPVPPTATATVYTPPTATPRPTETPAPIEAIKPADHYYLAGDFEKARRQYQLMADSTTSETDRAAAQLGLARIDAAEGNYEGCQNRLINALNETEAAEFKGPMWYQMAECVHGLKLIHEEINALIEYLKAVPESRLAFEIQERIGDRFFEIQEYESAMTYYSGLAEKVDLVSGSQIWMKVADTFFIRSDYSNALLIWVKIYDANTNEELRARINNLMARTYEIIGSQEQAYARYQDSVNNYPRAANTLTALQALNEAEEEVNQFQAGLIYYYRANYKLASTAFYRYLESGAGYDGALYYYLGVSQMYVGNYTEAIAAFENLIDKFPEDHFYPMAWEEKAYVQWYYMGNHQLGAETLLAYVAKHPDQAPAPDYLFQAGRVLETSRRLTDAAEQWERLIDEYPSYDGSEEALYLAGIARYRSGNYDAATATFNRALLIATSNANIAKANFWIGKTYEKKGDIEFAVKYYETAAAASPTDYYTERAADKLNSAEPLTFAAPGAALSDDISGERMIADQWMRLTFSIDPETNFDHPTLLSGDSGFQRAEELYRLGRFQDALDEYNEARFRYEADPVASYQLLNTLVRKEIYRPAVFISRNILTLAGLLEDARTLTAPNYFNRIRFGAWYSEEVLESWQEFKIHPYILYGMMRQESMYDPWISSSAGAQGLMQFMPATGQEMASALKWPADYHQSDLLRASVSIRFAGKYLSGQFAYFGQNPYQMLAAYNAGAGNTLRWVELADNDIDLFLEVIRFEETRRYLRHVYENAKMYERLYR